MKITTLVAPCSNGEDLQKEQFAIDVLTGLCATPKSLAAKYFYDDKGSEIFQKITQHPDYYPTRTEAKILGDNSNILPELVGEKEIDIVELGAGDGHKSQLIIEAFLEADCMVNYYPIDISGKAMKMLGENIERHDNFNAHGVVAEYFEGLRFVRQKSTNKQLLMFLGSNIGNFDRTQNQGFLRKLWINLDASDYVLLGFDLKKDIDILTSAYNDSGGHTRDFNLNLLKRINNELGGNFCLDKFQHFGVYNPILGAMESFVLASEEQDVYISTLERSFHFEAYEPIHLEYSFKFLRSDINYLSEKTGFRVIRNFADSRDYFIDSLWQVVKE